MDIKREVVQTETVTCSITDNELDAVMSLIEGVIPSRIVGAAKARVLNEMLMKFRLEFPLVIDFGQLKEIVTKVVGVTYDGRQGIIATLKKGQKVVLRQLPTNIHHKNAIVVETLGGGSIGYINRDLADALAPYFKESDTFTRGHVDSLHGRGGRKGLDIKFDGRFERDSLYNDKWDSV